MRPTSVDGSTAAMPTFKPRRTLEPRPVLSFAQQLGARQAAAPPPVGRAPTRPTPAPAAPTPSQPRSRVDQPVGRSTPPTTPARTTPPGTKRVGAAADPRGAGGEAATADALERSAIVARADALLGIPYVWGGNTLAGLDCSSYLSRVWNVPRQTTDTLSAVADPIVKAELRAGDALNLPTWKDPDRYGHVRLFDRWEGAPGGKLWVYEQTADTGRSVHRLIDWDDRYQPMRLRSLAS